MGRIEDNLNRLAQIRVDQHKLEQDETRIIRDISVRLNQFGYTVALLGSEGELEEIDLDEESPQEWSLDND